MVEVEVSVLGSARRNFVSPIFKKHSNGSLTMPIDKWKNEYLPDLVSSLSEYGGVIVTANDSEGDEHIRSFKFEKEEDYVFFCLKWS
jgi:hypothetical protein